MYKIQVVLVPPSAAEQQQQLFGNNITSPNLLSTSGSNVNNNINAQKIFSNGSPDLSLQYSALPTIDNLLFNTTLNNNINLKKFLLFTKPENTLLELSEEIIAKCNKIYPGVNQPIEILLLQDVNKCDLDPDFFVKDVFNIDNTVRVLLNDEIELDDTPSLYRSYKKQKLNNGVSQSASSQQTTGYNNGTINVAKRRRTAPTIKPSLNNNAMRISTPLAHQIYPPPNRSSNNSDEDDDDVDRSFLPPPNQPQSPQIRISSGIDNYKRIKSLIEDDQVSRSGTVDPNKSKQQRLLSGTPMRAMMTPNRVMLTGQRVLSEHRFSSLDAKASIFAPNLRSVSANLGTTSQLQKHSPSSRISSGTLPIPEPKLSEIEKELGEGISSPSSLLPAKGNRIPMKMPYVDDNDSDSSSNSDYIDQESKSSESKHSLQRQYSIANGNGSPVRNKATDWHNNSSDDSIESHPEQVKLAELPSTQRKISIAEKISSKNTAELDQMSDIQPKQTNHFLDEQFDAFGKQQSEPEQNISEATSTLENNNIGNTSFQKDEVLSMVEGEALNMSPWFKTNSKKPYTTVLYKDIDNSKPDPRNILPSRTPRNAARRAAEKLVTKAAPTSRYGARNDSSSEEEIGNDSDRVETDLSDDDHRIIIKENNNMKELKIHDLKESVVDLDAGKTDDLNNHEDNELDDSSSEDQESDRDVHVKDIESSSTSNNVNGNTKTETKCPKTVLPKTISTEVVRKPTFLESDEETNKSGPTSNNTQSNPTQEAEKSSKTMKPVAQPIKKLIPKPKPSLGSISDLASRGISETKIKTPLKLTKNISHSSSNNSDSSDDSSSSSSSDEDNNRFINIKSISAALGNTKRR